MYHDAVIKHDRHLRTRGKCPKHELQRGGTYLYYKIKLRSENWFTDSLNMSPSKFEPAAEKITENITDNPEPQSLVDSPTITCILDSNQIFYDKTITLGMLMKSDLGLQRLWLFSGAGTFMNIKFNRFQHDLRLFHSQVICVVLRSFLPPDSAFSLRLFS